MIKKCGVAILAAGQGKRLKLDLPKPLAPACGQVLVDYVMEAVEGFLSNCSLQGDITVVTGHRKEEVEAHFNKFHAEKREFHFAFQKEQKGTADALKTYYDGHLQNKEYEYTLVLCADTPLIRSTDLERLYKELYEKNLDGIAATFNEKNPKGYGRIIRSTGRATAGFSIVEEKDATDEQRKIKEVNSGLYLLKTDYVLKHLYNIGSNNASGEFYLTDLFSADAKVTPLLFEKSETFMGVNDLAQLEEASLYIFEEKRAALRNDGIRFIDSKTNYIDWKVTIKEGSLVNPNVICKGKTVIGKNVIIGAGSIITDSVIADYAAIEAYSVLEESEVKEKATVGPFARLRPQSVIGKKAKIGNFVEIKKSKLSDGAKVSHLSYVGDAEIGTETNIGCGFITCNYDGANKHKTIIGDHCFIGSDSQAVAPVTIGNNCFVASNTTITDDMPSGSFAISRNKQTTKPDLAHRFIKTKDSKTTP